MQGNDRLLITFSAGVAQWQEGETGQQVIKRADQGMYLAKRAGKNRVVAV
jgi:diguanylate cyclase